VLDCLYDQDYCESSLESIFPLPSISRELHALSRLTISLVLSFRTFAYLIKAEALVSVGKKTLGKSQYEGVLICLLLKPLANRHVWPAMNIKSICAKAILKNDIMPIPAKVSLKTTH